MTGSSIWQERDALAAVLERVREYTTSDPSLDLSENNPGRIILDILDSAPSVARPLPDREALIEVAEGVDMVREKGETRTYPTRILDAVLAAIEKGGE